MPRKPKPLNDRIARTKKNPKLIEPYRDMRETELAYLKEFPQHNIPTKPSRTWRVWNNLVKRKKFRRDCNFEWLIDYEKFVNDMGEAPSASSYLHLHKGMKSYTPVTCYWSDQPEIRRK
jgi:hypothetical protein